jgi:rubredoxin
MFKCSACDQEFDEPTYVPEKERIDYGIGAVWMTIYEYGVCPECGNPDYEEDLNDEDDDATVEDEVMGLGLQQAEAVPHDGQRVASTRQA